MNHFKVGPSKAQVISLAAPPLGVVRVTVRANAPVNVYALDTDGGRRYVSGDEFKPLLQSRESILHEFMLQPGQIRWILLIENPGSSEAVGTWSVITPSSTPTGPGDPTPWGA